MAFAATLSAKQVYPPLPTISELIAKEVAKMDEITSIRILAGFDYEIDGKLYHFGYRLDDQINFSQMNTAAVLAMQSAATGSPVEGINSDMLIEWQGHADGTSYTLKLTPLQFVTLSNAGGNHNKKMLGEGWVIKSQLCACTTEAELKAKVKELKLDEMHRDAMDLKTSLGL